MDDRQDYDESGELAKAFGVGGCLLLILGALCAAIWGWLMGAP